MFRKVCNICLFAVRVWAYESVRVCISVCYLSTININLVILSFEMHIASNPL